MSYQGWTNYESWAVALWLDNEPGLQQEAQRLVNRETNIYRAADALKTFVTEDVLPDLGASLAQDLLNAAVSNVNWYDVAEHFQDEDTDDEDDDDESGDAALVPATSETWPKGIDTLNTYEVSLDQSISDGRFKAKTSEDAVKKACAVRGWDYSEEVYNQAAWDLIEDQEAEEYKTLKRCDLIP